MRNTIYLLVLLVAAVQPTAAQWLKQPTRGIPRTADGKANLSAGVPRTADGRPSLSGMWQLIPGSYVVNATQDLDERDIAPSAEARYRQHLDDFAKDPGCFLPSGPRYYITGTPKIIQTSDLILILSEDLTYRQIFLDGRDLPKDPTPSFMGYSAGHWEDDTLVVESIGFNDRTLLDTGGHPHTEALHITERFHRQDFGHMDLQVNFSDPSLYAKPITVPVQMRYVADDELIEYICRENEQDYEHIGKASDERNYVAPEVLAQYVGVYTVGSPGDRNYTVLNVTLFDNELWIDRSPWMKGKDNQRLIPLSETTFAGNFGRRIHVEKKQDGVVLSLVFEAPEPPLSDVIAVRRESK